MHFIMMHIRRCKRFFRVLRPICHANKENNVADKGRAVTQTAIVEKMKLTIVHPAWLDDPTNAAFIPANDTSKPIHTIYLIISLL